MYEINYKLEQLENEAPTSREHYDDCAAGEMPAAQSRMIDPFSPTWAARNSTALAVHVERNIKISPRTAAAIPGKTR